MRKIMFYCVLAIAALLTGCASGNTVIGAEVVVSDNTALESTSAGVDATENVNIQQDTELLFGDWILDGAYTETANSISVRDLFGTSLGQYGSKLSIGADGHFEYFIGTLSARGTWSVDGDSGNYIASVVEFPNEISRNVIFHKFRENPESTMYLAMSYEGYTLFWKPCNSEITNDDEFVEIENLISFKGDTWQDVYKQILVSDPRNYLKVVDVGSNMNDRWLYLGIHDFDSDAIPELIIGDLISVAVFTFTDGEAQKLADLYIPDQEWCINGVYSKGNSISTQCNGAGGSNYVNFGFVDGKYVLGIYTELCNDYAPPVINGEPGTLDQMNQIYPVGDTTFPTEDRKEKVRLVNGFDHWEILLPSEEFLTVDESFDFEYFLWE